MRQAVRADSPAETLHALAHDPDILVRAAVAINTGCRPEVDAILARDEDDRVRALLGGRIARLLPGLDQLGQDGVALHVLRTLAALARDQAAKVRSAIAQEIGAMDTAPHELVLLLAQDELIEVSDPVLRLSPVLTDNDLLKLIVTPASGQAAQSIASRSNLSAAVADAIAAYADVPAIRTLLANRSASIQEATLDALVGRAPRHADWHEPLVRRPDLSATAVRALSEFVTSDMLRILSTRTDLDPAKLDVIRRRLAFASASDDDKPLLLDAERLKARSLLSEDVLLDAAKTGHSRRVAILLAVAADVTIGGLERVIGLRSAKALVSLAWYAGFTMRAGLAVQSTLAHISPDRLLMPTANGGFPLSRQEMEWHLELMKAIGSHPGETSDAIQ